MRLAAQSVIGGAQLSSVIEERRKSPAPSEPVHLVEDASTGDRFLIYGTEKGIRIELKYEGDTLWMTQSQIAELFGVTRQSVNSHLTNIYEEDELPREATCKEILQVRNEGGRDVNRKTLIHNLDAIIAVGYRVSSKQGTAFRRWATDKLVQFATKGFVVDAERLKAPDARDRDAAKDHADQQYRAFDEKRKAIRHAEADASLAKLKAEMKSLPKGARRKPT